MNEDEQDLQKSELEDNPISQAESQMAGKVIQQGQNVLRNATNKAKQAAGDLAKKAGKAVVKAVSNLAKLIFKFIMATAPVSFILIGVIIVAIFVIILLLALYDGITSVFKHDVKTADITTAEHIESLYEEQDYVDPYVKFNVSGSKNVIGGQNVSGGELVEIAKELHDYMRAKPYVYNNGNIMNYPTAIGQEDKSSCGIDCSAYITWILIMCGYTEFEGKMQLTTNDFIQWINGGTGNYNLAQYGWTYQKVADGDYTVEPGDLLLKTSKSAHIEMYAGGGTYGAGSNHAIQSEITYRDCTPQRIINLGNFSYIIKIK